MKLLPLLCCLSVAVCFQQYCKCQCNDQVLVDKVDKCGLCTKEWCLEQKNDLCEDAAESIIISCFQVESVKEKVVVCLFLVAVAGLLVRSFIP